MANLGWKAAIIFFSIVSGTPSSLVNDNVLDCTQCMVSLKHPDEISASHLTPLTTKQGTTEWFDLRKTTLFTGSTMYKGLGLGKLKDQKEFLKSALDEQNPAEVNIHTNGSGNDVYDVSDDVQHGDQDDDLQKRLEWGRDNEQHAAATVIAYALPLLYPNTMLVECGASFVKCEETGKNMIEVSADGLVCSVGAVTGQFHGLVAKTEFKCPYPPAPESYKLPVYYDLPKYMLYKCLQK